MLVSKFAGEPRVPESGAISRREILMGAAATALMAGAPSLAAGTGRRAMTAEPSSGASAMPVRRYMAAAVAMADGAVLVTGGYDRAWSGMSPPMALSSALVFDPALDEWRIAAEMSVPRARHAAALLPDGRVVVAGGMGRNPSASVEIYDPRSDVWEFAEPMSQPRYDHALVASGNALIVVGGSSLSIVSSVEQLRIGSGLRSAPNP